MSIETGGSQLDERELIKQQALEKAKEFKQEQEAIHQAALKKTKEGKLEEIDKNISGMQSGMTNTEQEKERADKKIKETSEKLERKSGISADLKLAYERANKIIQELKGLPGQHENFRETLSHDEEFQRNTAGLPEEKKDEIINESINTILKPKEEKIKLSLKEEVKGSKEVKGLKDLKKQAKEEFGKGLIFRGGLTKQEKEAGETVPARERSLAKIEEEISQLEKQVEDYSLQLETLDRSYQQSKEELDKTGLEKIKLMLEIEEKKQEAEKLLGQRIVSRHENVELSLDKPLNLVEKQDVIDAHALPETNIKRMLEFFYEKQVRTRSNEEFAKEFEILKLPGEAKFIKDNYPYPRQLGDLLQAILKDFPDNYEAKAKLDIDPQNAGYVNYERFNRTVLNRLALGNRDVFDQVSKEINTLITNTPRQPRDASWVMGEDRVINPLMVRQYMADLTETIFQINKLYQEDKEQVVNGLQYPEGPEWQKTIDKIMPATLKNLRHKSAKELEALLFMPNSSRLQEIAGKNRDYQLIERELFSRQEQYRGDLEKKVTSELDKQWLQRNIEAMHDQGIDAIIEKNNKIEKDKKTAEEALKRYWGINEAVESALSENISIEPQQRETEFSWVGKKEYYDSVSIGLPKFKLEVDDLIGQRNKIEADIDSKLSERRNWNEKHLGIDIFGGKEKKRNSQITKLNTEIEELQRKIEEGINPEISKRNIILNQIGEYHVLVNLLGCKDRILQEKPETVEKLKEIIGQEIDKKRFTKLSPEDSQILTDYQRLQQKLKETLGSRPIR